MLTIFALNINNYSVRHYLYSLKLSILVSGFCKNIREKTDHTESNTLTSIYPALIMIKCLIVWYWLQYNSIIIIYRTH